MAPSSMTDHLLARSESCVRLDAGHTTRKYVTAHSGTAVRRSYSVPSIPAKMRVCPSPVVVVKTIHTRHGASPRWTRPSWSHENTHSRDRYYYNSPYWPRYTGSTFSTSDSRYNLKNYYFPGSFYEPRFGWSALYYLDPAYYWRRGQQRGRNVNYDSYYGLGKAQTWADTYFPFGHTSSYRYYHDNDGLRHG